MSTDQVSRPHLEPWKGVLTIDAGQLTDACGDNGEDEFVLGVNHELHSLLTQYKEMITRFYRAKRWDRGKKQSNEYELVYTSQGDACPSIAQPTPASRSYFKMWELLHDFEADMFPAGGVAAPGARRCAFLAEGPGGFLEAYAEMRGSLLSQDTLHGMTLSPRLGQPRGSSMSVPYWRLPSWIAQRASALRICNGSSGDGDICCPENLDSLVKETGGGSTCDLVTADGGFDFTGDFNGQEQASTVLVASEVQAALRLQAVGGTFVLKIYDIHSYETFQLVHVLAQSYSRVHVVKPLTSRPANSEKYIVCTGFQGPSHKTQAAAAALRAFVSSIKGGSGAHTLQALPRVPLSILYALTHYNMHALTLQLLHISRTLLAIATSSGSAEHAAVHRQVECALRWCFKYGVPVSPPPQQRRGMPLQQLQALRRKMQGAGLPAAYLTPVWYRDPWVLMNRASLGAFVPMPDMPLAEQLNAVMRFALYFTLALAALRRDPSVLMLLVLAALFTYCVYEAEARTSSGRAALMEQLNIEPTGRPAQPKCYGSTRHNPFMNILPSDVRRFPNRPPACSLSERRVQERVASNFEVGLHREDGDIFKRTASDRQFYSMPATTLPNDQDAYMKWLYPLPPKTRKEGGDMGPPTAQRSARAG